MITPSLALVAALAAVMVLTGQGADSVLRHLYFIPTVWVALRRGAVAGGIIGALLTITILNRRRARRLAA